MSGNEKGTGEWAWGWTRDHLIVGESGPDGELTPDGFDVAEVMSGDEKDARLIAACPDLLEALEGLSDAWLAFQDAPSKDKWTAEEIVALSDLSIAGDKARAALARARGEVPPAK